MDPHHISAAAEQRDRLRLAIHKHVRQLITLYVRLRYRPSSPALQQYSYRFLTPFRAQLVGKAHATVAFCATATNDELRFKLAELNQSVPQAVTLGLAWLDWLVAADQAWRATRSAARQATPQRTPEPAPVAGAKLVVPSMERTRGKTPAHAPQTPSDVGSEFDWPSPSPSVSSSRVLHDMPAESSAAGSKRKRQPALTGLDAWLADLHIKRDEKETAAGAGHFSTVVYATGFTKGRKAKSRQCVPRGRASSVFICQLPQNRRICQISRRRPRGPKAPASRAHG